MQSINSCKPNFTVFVSDYTEKYEPVDRTANVDRGSYGSVTKVFRKSDGKIFAAKTSRDYSMVYEIYVYGTFNYSGIASVEEVYVKATDKGNEFTIILEYGVVLDKYLTMYNIPVENKKMMIYNIIATLSFMQKNGIIYGDIKPPNMIIADDKVKLVDFGLIYRENYGEADMSQTYNDLEGYNFFGKNIYVDDTMSELRTGLKYSYIDNAMWALGITIVTILTNDHFYHTDYIDDIPKIVYDLENNPRFVIDNVMLKDYPEWRDMVHSLMLPHDQRVKSYELLMDDPIFKDGKEYIDGYGDYYHNTPPPIVELVNNPNRDIIEDTVKFIITKVHDHTLKSLALEYYLRFPIDPREVYLDGTHNMYLGNYCQAVAAIYLADSIVYLGGRSRLSETVKAFLDIENKSDEYVGMYTKGVCHYISVYIGNTCGNLMIDIPYNDMLKLLDSKHDLAKQEQDPQIRQDNIDTVDNWHAGLQKLFDDVKDYDSYVNANKTIFPNYI